MRLKVLALTAALACGFVIGCGPVATTAPAKVDDKTKMGSKGPDMAPPVKPEEKPPVKPEEKPPTVKPPETPAPKAPEKAPEAPVKAPEKK